MPEFEGIAMALYEGREYPFSIQYPAEMVPVSDSVEEGDVTTILEIPEDSNMHEDVPGIQMKGSTFSLEISETDLNIFDDFTGKMSLDEFTEMHMSAALGAGINPTMLVNERRSNADGVPYHVFVFREGIEGSPLPLVFMARLIHIRDGEIRFMVHYTMVGEQAYEEFWPLADYSFDTFIVVED
jgi:hypothetical protein